MVDWKITAKTIYCEKVDDEVTIMVRNDWSVRCTGQSKYSQKSASGKNVQACEGPECQRVTEYQKQLIEEEG